MNQTSIFFQTGSDGLDIQSLPDGSMAIYDRRSKSVHSLNKSASILWEACAGGATLQRLTEALEERQGVRAAEHEVAAWIDEMRRLELIISEGPPPLMVPEPKRRSLLATLGGVLPIVLTMTAAEQRAFARNAGSGGSFTTHMMTTSSGGFTTTFMSTRMMTTASGGATTTGAPTTRR